MVRKLDEEVEKRKILDIILYKPQSITDLSKEIKRDRGNVSRFVNRMKEYLLEKEEVRKCGKCHVLYPKPKAFQFMGIQRPKKSKVTTKKVKHDYLNDDELELIHPREKEW